MAGGRLAALQVLFWLPELCGAATPVCSQDDAPAWNSSATVFGTGVRACLVAQGGDVGAVTACMHTTFPVLGSACRVCMAGALTCAFSNCLGECFATLNDPTCSACLTSFNCVAQWNLCVGDIGPYVPGLSASTTTTSTPTPAPTGTSTTTAAPVSHSARQGTAVLACLVTLLLMTN